MIINAYTLNAFAQTPQCGNPAGVVFDADGLSEQQMQQIASVLGFSETAFVMQSDVADFKVRFFTPNQEVDLCGHATIATFYAMASLNRINPGSYQQETKAGVLGVEVSKDHFVMMEQAMPIFSEIVAKEEIAASLNLTASQIASELPVQVVSTGLRDILVPVKSVKILHAIQPDYHKIENLSKQYQTVGYHVFALTSLDEADAYCRNFAPLYDIPEEAATGTSNGALGCYLNHYGKVSDSKAQSLVFRQGYSMKKPSEIRVSLDVKQNQISTVKVGGKATPLLFSQVGHPFCTTVVSTNS